MAIVQTAARAAAVPLRAAARTWPGRALIAGTVVIALMALIAGLVALAAAAVTACGAWLLAWRRGWEARRLRGVVAGLGLGYLAVTMLWHWSLTAPFEAFWQGLGHVRAGFWSVGLVETSVLWWPLGLTAGAAWWARYRDRMRTGRARSVRWAERHVERQFKRRLASARSEARGTSVPLLSRDSELVLGPFVEETGGVPRHGLDEITARHPRHLTVPPKAVDQHLAVVGDSGSGKTTLLRRLAVARTESEWRRYKRGEAGRPLTIMVNCKGGSFEDIVNDGGPFVEDMVALGLHPQRVGMWPVDCRLDIWSMAPRDLQSTLLAMVRSSHEHFDELRESLLHLVIDAPRMAPPRSSVEFLRRINEHWLRTAWAGHAIELGMVSAVCEGREPAYKDALLKYANLFRNLGRALDAGSDLDDYDALYIAVAGTRRPKEAQAQAQAIIQLVSDLLHRKAKRKVTVILDEYSAVSGEGGIGLVSVVERWRSLGGSVVVAAQSWQGLGDTDDERKRLVNTCSGGRLLLRTPDAEELSARSGTIRVAEQSQHLVKGRWGTEGAVRMQDAFVVPPQRLREFQPGDVVYAHGGRGYWGAVALVPPMRPAELTLPGHQARPALTQGPAVPVNDLERGLREVLEPDDDGAAEDGGPWS